MERRNDPQLREDSWLVRRVAGVAGAMTLIAGLGVGGLAWSGDSGTTNTSASTTTTSSDKPVPEFTEAFMNDDANIEIGRGIWKKRCKFCHGNSAYPGKAPKLKPKRYETAFVYKRVTYGFRGMPSFSHEFDEQQRMAVTAYIKHKSFSQK